MDKNDVLYVKFHQKAEIDLEFSPSFIHSLFAKRVLRYTEIINIDMILMLQLLQNVLRRYFISGASRINLQQ